VSQDSTTRSCFDRVNHGHRRADGRVCVLQRFEYRHRSGYVQWFYCDDFIVRKRKKWLAPATDEPITCLLCRAAVDAYLENSDDN
jgi:hypothetical protein